MYKCMRLENNLLLMTRNITAVAIFDVYCIYSDRLIMKFDCATGTAHYYYY